MTACTIVARNYLAQARVLVRSFKRHHPDCSFVILIVDELASADSSTEDARLLNLNDIGLEDGEAHRMAMIYNVTELSTAMKPWLLRHLLAANSCPVVYFDPDIEIFGPLHDIAKLAQEHAIVLTPHVTEPMPRDKLSLSESDILGSGIYNLGFIGIGPGSESFLDWWAARLRRESVVDPIYAIYQPHEALLHSILFSIVPWGCSVGIMLYLTHEAGFWRTREGCSFVLTSRCLPFPRSVLPLVAPSHPASRDAQAG